MRARFAVLLFAALALASCSKDDGGPPIKPKPPMMGHEIVFFGRAPSDSTFTHLFVVNADGSGLYQLTSDSLSDEYPRWSPDGAKIVFLRRYGGNGDSANVTVMDADGSNMVRLTHDLADYNPSWSSDGTQIAFQHFDAGGPTEDVWVMGADGFAPRLYMDSDSTGGCSNVTLTQENTLLGNELFGLWMQPSPTATSMTRIFLAQAFSEANARLSPNGDRIAFSWGDRNGTQGPFIQTINADGTGVTQLTHGFELSPAWSPDGTRIAYVSGRAITDGGVIWVMNADGTNPQQVTSLTSVNAFELGDWK